MRKKLLGGIAMYATLFVLIAAIIGLGLWLGGVMPMHEFSGGKRLTNGLLWLMTIFALCGAVGHLVSRFLKKLPESRLKGD